MGKKLSVKMEELKVKYSITTGVWKAIKNCLIIWAPAILAMMANVPVEYTPIASLVVYFLKNLLEYKYDYKV